MDAKKLKQFFKKNIEWTIHFFIWFFMIGERWINHAPQKDKFLLFGIYQTILIVLVFILPFYINAFLLIPKYLRRFKWFKYGLYLLTVVLITNILHALLNVLYIHLHNYDYVFYDEFLRWSIRDYQSLERFIFSPAFSVLLVSFAYRFIKDWILNEQFRSKLQTEKASIELAFLKSQVNPHFLFNSLNSIYALALGEKAQLTADGVAKMGTLMRYTLHDSQVEKILLSRELDYIDKYVELQKLRIVEGKKSGIKLFFNLDGESLKKIAPMILIPFIENAFKHGVSLIEEIDIEIRISVSGNNLEMIVKNKIYKENDIEESGVGLKNVEKRLKLTYPRRYDLKTVKNISIYLVKLKIDLKE